MNYRIYLREKKHPLILRILWRLYYVTRNFLSSKSMLQFIVNAIWVLNAFAWEQARLFERTLSLDSKSDLMRPRNISDATSGLCISDRVCDFGGGLGDISKALFERG